jgi:hypothetical protein
MSLRFLPGLRMIRLFQLLPPPAFQPAKAGFVAAGPEPRGYPPGAPAARRARRPTPPPDPRPRLSVSARSRPYAPRSYADYTLPRNREVVARSTALIASRSRMATTKWSRIFQRETPRMPIAPD